MAQAYLIIRSTAPASAFWDFCKSAETRGIHLVAAQPVHKISVLEPGSVPKHTWVGLFNSRADAKNFWNELEAEKIAKPEAPLVMVAGAVPESGLDDDFIPTKANVDAGSAQPPTLMIIEGSAEDQDAMDQYRDIILPMMKRLRAYYTVFELGGSIEVLSGDWDEAIFAISRWPSAEAARRFWLDETYQKKAIPLRLGHSAFQVVTLQGEPDD